MRIFAAIILIVSLSGCSIFKSKRGIEDEARPLKLPDGSISATEVPQQISREKLVASWNKAPRVNALRMVEIYDRGQLLPRHRLFDIRSGSVYELIVLKERDIVIAADDFLIYDAGKFIAYVQLMTQLPEAKILIEREGAELAMKYTIE